MRTASWFVPRTYTSQFMNEPLISIILTVLNGEKTIGQCLDSIYYQSFVNYEVIVVDGGSTDRTVEIVNASPLINKKVCVIPGLGLYAGLNTGIRMADGKWLYFIGCDDELYSPDTLQQVADSIAIKNKDAQVLVGHVECVKQENLLRVKFGSPYWMRYRVHHQGMFYKRELFANSFYNETMRIASDYEFNLKLALDNVPHQAMDLIICNFGGDGVSENQIDRGSIEMQEVHKRLFKGAARQWVLNYFQLQRKIITIRKRLNLVNLKVRFRRLLKRRLSI
jgi:putative colanic acid biosynthesis glycosyltransferase